MTRSGRGSARLSIAGSAAFVVTVVLLGWAPEVTAPAAASVPGTARSAMTESGSGSTSSPLASAVRSDRVIVRTKPGKGLPRGARALASTSLPGGHGAVHLVQVPVGTVSEELAKLRKDPSVDLAQPDHVYSSAAVTPNDTFYSEQWGPGFVSAPQAWATTTGGANTPVIALLDTGIDYTHPDLQANVWSNPGGVGGCPAGTHGFNEIASPATCDPMDDAGHGTHVAGIAGAVGNNGVGIAGIAWQAKLMAVKMLDSQGNGDDFTAINAINWVISAKTQDNVNVRVINASWGGVGQDPLLENAIANAWNHGILFVTAAGNESTDNDASASTFQDPCGAPQAICVAAIDETGNKADFSNWGVNTVALAAPGADILSTWTSHQYASLSGTSMAAPHVTGAAALLASACPSFSPAQLRERLLDVTPDPALRGLVATGGYLDVYRALNAPSRVSVVQNVNSATLSWSPPCAGGAPLQIGLNGHTYASTSGSSYAISGLITNTTYAVSVTPTSPPGPSTTLYVTPLGGGYVLDGWGGLHGFGSAGPQPPAPSGGPYWRSWSIARGVALLPSGTGGYVLDGYGGLHPFAIGPGPAPPAAEGGPYWPGWDIARGVTILNDGSGGYVVDGFGGLHPFEITGGQTPPATSGGAYWTGWDIARGVAIVPGVGATTGGYVLDGFGGLHAFGIGGGAQPAVPSGAPYWPAWDIARGLTMARNGSGGFVTDAWGGLHPFGSQAGASGGPYWRGWQVADGVGL
ncbi:MAG: S8 family serine peptidase [Actinobacteria bacterium]|nr:S8 family serine peptidase [Actinomycetota bacterium]